MGKEDRWIAEICRWIVRFGKYWSNCYAWRRRACSTNRQRDAPGIIRTNRLYSDHTSNSVGTDTTSTSWTRVVANSDRFCGTRQSSEISFREARISAKTTLRRWYDMTRPSSTSSQLQQYILFSCICNNALTIFPILSHIAKNKLFYRLIVEKSYCCF